MTRLRPPRVRRGMQLAGPQPVEPMALPELPTMAAAQSPFPNPMDPMAFLGRQDRGDHYDDGDNWGYGGGQMAEPPAPITPEEEQGYLGKTLGGVGWLADSLGKLGYATRGVLAGKPDALLNAIPFYDTIQGFTKDTPLELPEAPKVSGWDLGEAYGMPENKPGLDPWDVPKFALEFLDPAMALTTLPRVAGVTAKGLETAGRLAKGTDVVSDVAKAATAGEKLATAEQGLAAAARGVRPLGSVPASTPLALADQIRSGERAVAGLQLPFTKQPFATMGAGSEWGANLVEKLGYGKYSPVPLYRGLMSKTVGGTYDPQLQQAADKAFAEIGNTYLPAMQNAAPVWRAGYEEIKATFEDVAKSLGKQGDQFPVNDMVRDVMTNLEGVPDPAGIARKMADHLGIPRNAPLPARLQAIADSGENIERLFKGVQSFEDTSRGLAAAEGVPVEFWNGQGFERYGTRMAAESITRQAKYDMLRARRAYLNNIPNSSVVANQAARDQALRGVMVLPDGTVRRLTTDEHKFALLSELPTGALANNVPELQKALLESNYIKPALDEAVRLGRKTQLEADAYLNKLKLPEEVVTTKGGISKTKLNKSPLDQIVRALNRLPAETAKTGIWDKDFVTEAFAYGNRMVQNFQTARTTQNFLRQPGVVGLAAKMGNDAIPLLNAWKETGLTETGLRKFIAETYKVAPDAAKTFAKDLRVSPNAIGLLRHYRDLQKPKVAGKLAQAWDRVQGVWKAWWTIPRFAFHIRNDVGNFANAAAEGLVNTGQLAADFARAHAYMGSGGKAGGLKYVDEFLGLGGLRSSGIEDLVGLHASMDDLSKASLRGITDDFKEAATHPLRSTIGSRGVFATGGSVINPLTGKMAEKATNPLLAAGGKAFKLIESGGKIGYYESLRKAGFAPAQALHYVERAMFDYSKGSPFSRNVMRRIMPFWGWTSNNIPLQISRLVERPVGGVTGAMVKTMGAVTSNQGEFVPSFLREGLGIRLSGDNPEETAFIKQTGLPIEDLNKAIFTNGVPNLTRTAERNFSMLTPAIVSPTELLLTKKQSYSGWPLKELDSVTGFPSLDTILHYSPASSLVGDYGSLGDARKTGWQKALNYFTGAKVGTYDADKLRINELQRAITAELLEDPMVYEKSIPVFNRKYKGTPEAAELHKKFKRVRQLSKLRQQAAEKKAAAR